MAFLIAPATELLQNAAKSGSAKIIITLLEKRNPLADEKAGKKRAAKVQAFFGDPTAELKLEMAKSTEYHVDELKRFWAAEKRVIGIQGMYDEWAENITYLESLKNIMKDDPVSRRNFQEQVEQKNPILYAELLRRWVVEEDEKTGKQRLCDELMEFCNLEEFNLWQTKVESFLKQAFELKKFYYPQMDDPKDAGKADQLTLIQQEDTRCQEWISQIRGVFAKKRAELKVDLIFTAKNTIKDKVDLGLKAYLPWFIADNLKNNDNEGVANLLQCELTKRHNQFRWSVVVFDDYKRAEVHIDAKRINSLYFLKLGPKTGKEKEMSVGKGGFGLILCCHKTPVFGGRQKAIFVFWADPDLVQIDETWKADCKQLQDAFQINDNSNTEAAKIVPKGIYDTMDELQQIGMSLVFAVEMPLQHFAKLANVNGAQYPMTLSNSNSIVFIWPRLQKFPVAATVTLVPRSETSIKPAKFGRFYEAVVTKEKLVAVRQIDLSLGADQISEDKRTSEIVKLKTLMRTLQRIKNDNIIEYLGYQINKPRKTTGTHTFCVIMEWMNGLTLEDWLNKHTATINQIRKWGLAVLLGLEYLHSKGHTHGAINARNIMFTGPKDLQGTNEGEDQGYVKIISLGRIETALNRTLDKNMIPKVPLDKKSGRKNDVRNYAWLLGHMIIGREPDPKFIADSISVPDLPRGTNAAVQKIIDKCCLPYEERPESHSLLKEAFFESMSRHTE